MRFSDLNGIFGAITETVTVPTIATTGNTDAYFTCKYDGELLSAYFIATDALAQHGSNYITASITNLGQAGAGSNAMLAASDANTTKTTTGAAVAAHTQRTLTLHGTTTNLRVTRNDRLRIRFAATGTLANTVTGGVLVLVFKRFA